MDNPILVGGRGFVAFWCHHGLGFFRSWTTHKLDFSNLFFHRGTCHPAEKKVALKEAEVGRCGRSSNTIKVKNLIKPILYFTKLSFKHSIDSVEHRQGDEKVVS